MRIIGGQWRGRRLTAPSGPETRPTADRTREAVFNILAAYGLPDGTTMVLDVFAGTGALGLEALSRGAGRAIFLETGRSALAALESNIAGLGLGAQAQILRCDALRPPRCRQPADLIFLDPPYHQGLVLPALLALERQGWLAPAALAVVETAHSETFPPDPATLGAAGFELQDQRRYGPARLSFLSRFSSLSGLGEARESF